MLEGCLTKTLFPFWWNTLMANGHGWMGSVGFSPVPIKNIPCKLLLFIFISQHALQHFHNHAHCSSSFIMAIKANDLNST